MWLLSISLFLSLKWLTWWQARNRIAHPAWRSVAYLLAWPGMDADAFLNPKVRPVKPGFSIWFGAILETSVGAALIWLVARFIPPDRPMLAGWTGMVGLIFFLHFGMFQLAALGWRSIGVDAERIMAAPLRSTSLAEFWGKRWNLGFRELTHKLVFRPLGRKVGAGGATLAAFAVSGLIHDLVISLPARGGYGLPTLYFVLQGVGVALERSQIGKRLSLGRGAGGWLFMILILILPIYGLFHPWFVLRVILPFMRVIHAI